MPTETNKERVDRELIELTTELRVALPGVQVLFAFLLAVPFQAGFDDTTQFQRYVLYVTMVFTFVATALMIAPSAFHRLNFRSHNKEWIVKSSNVMMIGGIGALAIAMVGVITLITEVVLGHTLAAVTGICGFILLTVLWVAIPLIKRARDGKVER